MHQENVIQELNDAVCRQEQIIERLEREMVLMREQLRMLASSSALDASEEETPPHY